jgi:steroid delta-isomerase-like uncharacterized protein
MSQDEIKSIVRYAIEEFLNKGNMTVADELFATHFINHSPSLGTTPDREGLKQYITVVRTIMPDCHFTVEDLIAEGDKVVCRMTVHGTHSGEIMGIPPTGKALTTTATTILRLEGGKVVERWNNTDDLGLLQQIGILPALW